MHAHSTANSLGFTNPFEFSHVPADLGHVSDRFNWWCDQFPELRELALSIRSLRFDDCDYWHCYEQLKRAADRILGWDSGLHDLNFDLFARRRDHVVDQLELLLSSRQKQLRRERRATQ